MLVEPPAIVETKVEVKKVSPIYYNCYLYIKSKIPEFPSTKDLIPNSIFPNVGGVVILQYDRLAHYALIEAVVEAGVWISETNFEKGKFTKRLLTWNYLENHQAQYWYSDA